DQTVKQVEKAMEENKDPNIKIQWKGLTIMFDESLITNFVGDLFSGLTVDDDSLDTDDPSPEVEVAAEKDTEVE
ncbi:unnamed protein product, partial [marine sediment metagenome]